MPTIICFASGRGVTPRQKIIVWLITRIGRQTFTHVSFGNERWMVNPRPEGDRLHHAEHFLLRAPGLAWMFVVPSGTTLVRVDRRVAPWRLAAIRWVLGRFGRRVRPRDCVCKVVDHLTRSGVYVPENVYTPDALWDFLRASGYEMVEFDP